MVITSKLDYGLLVMVELAKQVGESYVSLNDIAEQNHISARYLSQLMKPLKAAGLVVSKEGQSGGYRISKPAESINLREIVEAIDGPLELVKCMEADTNCPAESDCGVKPVWNGLNHQLYTLLEAKTLHDII